MREKREIKKMRKIDYSIINMFINKKITIKEKRW